MTAANVDSITDEMAASRIDDLIRRIRRASANVQARLIALVLSGASLTKRSNEGTAVMIPPDRDLGVQFGDMNERLCVDSGIPCILIATA